MTYADLESEWERAASSGDRYLLDDISSYKGQENFKLTISSVCLITNGVVCCINSES